MAGRTARRARIGALLVGCGAALGHTDARADAALTIDVLAGVDTNPLEIQDDGPGGAYSEVRISTSGSVPLSPRSTLRLSGTVGARVYDSSVADAGRELGLGRIGFETTFGPIANRPVVLGIGVLGAIDRSTFTDPATGRVYTVDAEPATVPPTAVPIPRRFDSDTSGGFVDAHFRLGRRVSAFVASTIQSVDFVEEYGDRTALESLDYRLLVVEPGVRISLHQTAALRFSVASTDVEYDEQPAIDTSGVAVPGVSRAYRATDLHLALSLVPAARFRLDVDLRGGARTDAYAGYYDLDALGASIRASHRPNWRTRLELVASSRDVAYAHAAVTTSVEGRLRGSRADRFAGRVEYDLRRSTTLYTETGVENVDNNDAELAHGRSWLAVGLRYRP
jgi:hypothetical protein